MKSRTILLLVLGLVTLLPLAYWVVLFTVVVPSGGLIFVSDASPTRLQHAVNILFASQIANTVFTLGLISFYLVLLYRSNRVPQERKALWAVLLVLGSILAMPVFWYMYFRPTSTSEWRGLGSALENEPKQK